ncbi:MAG: hypothetical protein IKP66_05715 [Lachnospiraceae bacterium]|nr:hypothetical protein [Lachnospiraceae bacterium]
MLYVDIEKNNNDYIYIVGKDRPIEFTVTQEEGAARCHRLSWNLMVKIMVRGLNQKNKSIIEYLIHAVVLFEKMSDEALKKSKINMYSECLNNIDLSATGNIFKTLYYANKILFNLYSEANNVKLGNPDLNMSVKTSFDACSVVHRKDNDNNDYYFLTNESDSQCIKYLIDGGCIDKSIEDELFTFACITHVENNKEKESIESQSSNMPKYPKRNKDFVENNKEKESIELLSSNMPKYPKWKIIKGQKPVFYYYINNGITEWKRANPNTVAKTKNDIDNNPGQLNKRINDLFIVYQIKEKENKKQNNNSMELE